MTPRGKRGQRTAEGQHENTRGAELGAGQASYRFALCVLASERCRGLQLKRHIEATLGSGNIMAAVQLPPGEDLQEWLAVNTVDFYNAVSVLYATLGEFWYPYAHTNKPEDEQPCDELSTLPGPAKYTPHADPLPCTRYPHANTKETEDEQLCEQPSKRPGPAMHAPRAGMLPRTRYSHAYTNETEDEQPCAQPSMLPGPAVYAPHADPLPCTRYPHANTKETEDEQPCAQPSMLPGPAVYAPHADPLPCTRYPHANTKETEDEQPCAQPSMLPGPAVYAPHAGMPPRSRYPHAHTNGAEDEQPCEQLHGRPIPHGPPTHDLYVDVLPLDMNKVMRMCAEKDIHHIISHVEQTGHGHNATAVDPAHPTVTARNLDPSYMERQYEDLDEAPESTPDIDLGRNQHHSPPPPPTPNRQYITLTTFNVRGLHRSRNEVLNLVHSQSPDILILTETMTQPRSNNPSSGWLKRVMPNYTVHRHQGHSEVLIGIRHDLAIQMQATMIQPCTDADVNTRCVILSLRQRQIEELTLVATYWPSGNNDDALPLRKKMQEYIRTATGHLPGSLILAGGINATMKTEDRSEHSEYTQDTMMREFATEMRLSEADPGDRAWTYQQPHSNSRIDAILTRDARHGPEHRTHVDTNAYLSDHRPLTATLSTARLGIDLAAPQKPQKHSHTILTTPITNKDREAYRLAVQQPSSGAPQLHAHLTAYLAPMYTDAIHFLTTIDKANPQQPQRLTLHNNVHPTIDELIPETDTANAETREAVQARQGDDTTENHVQAALARLTNSYRD
ncbi:hypothetical protein QJQ45_010822 [Haematococcus lacustris]|nr:hypothetical protein QJQ45_010822 [Haematococcus lacustris]